MTIKAIETSYNGYRFRSRLEARWAVFFDTLGIEYLYESEGYVLDNGTHYLPDFHLPMLDTIAEVKGQTPNRNEERKLEDLALSLDKIPLFLIGTPGDESILVYCFDCKESSAGDHWKDEFYWHIVEEQPKFWFDEELYPDGSSCRIYLRSETYEPLLKGFPRSVLRRGRRRFYQHGRLSDAYDQARSARFEFGDLPCL